MAEDKEKEEKIRELEEKIKRLEERQGRRSRGGVAGGVLRGLGEFIPGLGKLLEGLEDSEAFQERLDAINKEVDKRLRETPLKRTGEGRSSIPRKGSMPGRTPFDIERNFSFRTLAPDVEKPKISEERTTRPKPTKEKVEKEVPVDIFEEDDYLKVIAELPGVEGKDIKAELREDSLVISASTPYRRYYKEVSLPCPVRDELEASYKNGILEIRLKK